MEKINRRIALQRTFQSTAMLGLGALWQSSNAKVASGFSDCFEPSVEDSTAWFDVSGWEVEGRCWADTAKPFDRFPKKSEALLRKAVWSLSRHSAGMKMRWVNVSRPTQTMVEATLANGIDALPEAAPRQFALYLPLYNGVEKLEIGIRKGSELKPIAARKKPIVFYGTSIMHGACASRPGMSISSILGRRMNCAVVNLGFSGNGKMELPVADLIGELDPSVIAIDCLPNMNSKLVHERAVPFVQRLRTYHPKSPILLVEDRAMTNSRFYRGARDFHKGNRASLKAACDILLDAGDNNIHYLSGKDLLGSDGEGATDGSHPSDLGMVRYADAYEPVLRSLLTGKGNLKTQ